MKKNRFCDFWSQKTVILALNFWKTCQDNKKMTWLPGTWVKISTSSSFMTFHNKIFVVFVFNEISKRMIVTIEKEPSEYFQRLHFWNQWIPLIKMYCRVRYLLDFDLKIHSGQVCRSSCCRIRHPNESLCDHHFLVVLFSKKQNEY